MAYDFNNAGTEATAPTSGSEKELLRHRSTPFFLLMHHPLAWEVGETSKGPMWLPKLKHFDYKAGVHGNRQNKRGAIVNFSKVRFMDADWTLLPAVIEFKDGSTVAPCIAYDGYKGKVHLERWNNVKQVGKRLLEKFDHATYNEFRLKLIEDGLLELPDPDVLLPLIERSSRHVNRAAEMPASAGSTSKLKKAQKRAKKVEVASKTAGKQVEASP